MKVCGWSDDINNNIVPVLEEEGGASVITFETPPSTEQTPLCRQPSPVIAEVGESEVHRPVSGSLMESPGEGIEVVAFPTMPGVNASLPAVVEIMELNMTPSDPIQERTTPSTGTWKVILTRLKLKANVGSRANADKTLLENSSLSNENNVVRRSTRHTSKSSADAVTTSSSHNENARPQKAKRLKSACEKKTVKSNVALPVESLITKKPRGRKAKKVTNDRAELPSLVAVKEELQSEFANEATSHPDADSAIGIDVSSPVLEERTFDLDASEVDSCGSAVGVATNSISTVLKHSDSSDATDATNIICNLSPCQSISMENERNRRNRFAPDETNLSWARFIIGPTVQCEALRGESQIWVEYDTRNTIQVTLAALKQSLGITADVALYLQGFYVQPQLKASLLLKTQDPVVLMPCGQTQFAFGREGQGGPWAITVGTPPSTEQTPLFKQPSPVIVQARESEVPRPVSGSLMECPGEGNELVALSTMLGVNTTLPADVEIMELNMTPSDPIQAPTTPSTGTRKVSLRPRKLKVDVASPANADKTLLENSSFSNENNPVRRSTRRTPNSPADAVQANKKRASPVHDENAPPQKTKRLKSTCEKETDKSNVELPAESPTTKKPRGRKPKKVTNDMAEVPSLIAIKLEELLGSVENETALGPVLEERTSCDLDASNVDNGVSTVGVATISVSTELLESSYSTDATNIQCNLSPNKSLSMENVEQQMAIQRPDAPLTIEGIPVVSSTQIVPGSVIQANMLLQREDESEAFVTTHVMKVIAVEGETFTAVTPAAVFEVGIDIDQVFTLCFNNLIQPKLLDEVIFQNLVEALGFRLMEAHLFDENMF